MSLREKTPPDIVQWVKGDGAGSEEGGDGEGLDILQICDVKCEN